ncbi:hypothetical protein VNI00_003665 [Paramarasmius palmivorus]|uniref:F-actin-capping protein subunit alpha n=1 Tax=Paramarasmius palmivorus TaxID=297713 RepID=A0AAW0DPX0_9AGAR
MSTTTPSATLKAAVDQLISVALNENHDEALRKRVETLEMHIKARDDTIRLLRDSLADLTIATPPLSAPSDSLVLRAPRTYPREAHAIYPDFIDEGWPEKLDFHAQLAIAIARAVTGLRIVKVNATDRRNGRFVDYEASCMLTSERDVGDTVTSTLTLHFSLHFQNATKGTKTEKIVRYVPDENVHLSDGVLEVIAELKRWTQFELDDVFKFLPNARAVLDKAHDLQIEEQAKNTHAMDIDVVKKGAESDSALSEEE